MKGPYATRSLVTGVGASKRTTSITTGLESAVAEAPAVGRLHLSAGAFSAVYALPLAGAVPSLVAARGGALFVGRGGAEAPDRLPDASTVRRWSSGEDDSPSAGSFLREMLARVAQSLAFTDSRQDGAAFLSWLTPVLELLRPLRL